MHAIIRRYRTHSVDEVVNRIRKEFLSVITNAPGFVAYYVIDEGHGVQSSISVFENEQYAAYSNKLASYWVKEHAAFLLDSPDITSGEVLLYQTTPMPDGLAAVETATGAFGDS